MSAMDIDVPLAADIAVKYEAEQDAFADKVERLRPYLAPQTVESLDALLETKDKLSRRIGFIGDRGSGKTTLLNKLLGSPLLPTGRSSAITACVTEVFGRDNSSYLATVTFVELSDWEEAVTTARSELRSERAKQHPSLPLSAKLLHQQLKSLWATDTTTSDQLTGGSVTDTFGWESKEVPKLLPPTHLEQLTRGYITLISDDIADFATLLKHYTHRNCSYWPLVAKVCVWGPFDLLLRNNFSLIDIPGSNDGDEALHIRCTNGLNMCDEVFFLPNDTVLASAKTAEWLEELTFHPSLSYSICLTKYKSILCTYNEECGLTNLTPDGLTDKFRELQSKFIALDEHRNRFYNTRVFCLENKEPNYDDLHAKFIDHLGVQRSTHIQEQRDRYSSSFFMAFESIRISLDADSTIIPSLLTDLKALACVFTDLSLLSRPALPNILCRSAHWNSLRAGLRDQSYAWDVANVILYSEPASDALRRASLTVTKLRESMVELVGRRMQEHSAFVSHFKASLGFLGLDRIDLVIALQNCVQPFCRTHPGMVETGSGCAERMLKKLNDWWVKDKDAILDICMLRIPTLLQTAIQNAIRSIHGHLTRTLLSQHSSHKDSILAIINESNQLPPLQPLGGGVSNLPASSMPSLQPLGGGVSNQLPPLQPLGGRLGGGLGGRVSNLPASSMPSLQPLGGGVSNPPAFSIPLQALIVQHPDILSLPIVRTSRRTDGKGYVYVVYNPSFRGDNLVKIGETGRSVEKRMADFDTGVPESFVPLKVWNPDRRSHFEKTMHAIFAKVRVPSGREFFCAPLDLIVAVGNILAGDPQFGCTPMP